MRRRTGIQWWRNSKGSDWSLRGDKHGEVMRVGKWGDEVGEVIKKVKFNVVIFHCGLEKL